MGKGAETYRGGSRSVRTLSLPHCSFAHAPESLGGGAGEVEPEGGLLGADGSGQVRRAEAGHLRALWVPDCGYMSH